jgi:hypothetical protein
MISSTRSLLDGPRMSFSAPARARVISGWSSAERRVANAVESVLIPARSNRMVRRWQGFPSWTALTAAETTPDPHSGLPVWTTLSPNLNSCCKGMTRDGPDVHADAEGLTVVEVAVSPRRTAPGVRPGLSARVWEA